MSMAVSKERVAVWRVTHPDHEPTVVRAVNWEQATVEAAIWWQVPWGKVAAECEVSKIGDLPRNVCMECGKIFHAEGLLCELCAAKARDAELNRVANARRFWREMAPR